MGNDGIAAIHAALREGDNTVCVNMRSFSGSKNSLSHDNVCMSDRRYAYRVLRCAAAHHEDHQQK